MMGEKTVSLMEGLRIHQEMMGVPALDRIGRFAAEAFSPSLHELTESEILDKMADLRRKWVRSVKGKVANNDG